MGNTSARSPANTAADEGSGGECATEMCQVGRALDLEGARHSRNMHPEDTGCRARSMLLCATRAAQIDQAAQAKVAEVGVQAQPGIASHPEEHRSLPRAMQRKDL